MRFAKLNSIKRAFQHIAKYPKLESYRFKYTMCDKVSDDVILRQINHVGCITLNRPKRLNAFDISMVKKILHKLQEWEKNSNISVILLMGSGDKAFCAGGDIKLCREYALNSNIDDSLDVAFNESRLIYLIANYKKPIVVLMNGITMGGGLALSINCQYKIATEKSILSVPETSIGFFPDLGISHALSRLHGNLGLFLGLTGYRLSGKDAYNAGIATHYIESSKLEEVSNKLFEMNFDGNNLNNIFDQFNAAKRQEIQIKEISSIFSADSIENIFKNLKNADTEWSNQQMENLLKMSPTSLKVTFKQFNLAASSTLEETLERDLILTMNLMNHDFLEGVRALLIDKDHKPNWNPPYINEINDEKIEKYFEEPENHIRLELSRLNLS